jgi:rubredoxin
MEALEEQHHALAKLVEHGMLGQGDVRRTLNLNLDGKGPVALDVIDVLEGGFVVSDRVTSGTELPLRSASLRLVTVNYTGSDFVQLRSALLEINRVLTEGGIVLLRSELSREEVPRLLLTTGFAVSDPQAVSGFSVGVKVWKSYARNRCPRCGSEMTIPLIPEDSTSIRVWSFYCSSCGYVWNSEEPVLRLTF